MLLCTLVNLCKSWSRLDKSKNSVKCRKNAEISQKIVKIWIENPRKTAKKKRIMRILGGHLASSVLLIEKILYIN